MISNSQVGGIWGKNRKSGQNSTPMGIMMDFKHPIRGATLNPYWPENLGIRSQEFTEAGFALLIGRVQKQ